MIGGWVESMHIMAINNAIKRQDEAIQLTFDLRYSTILRM